MAYKIVGVNETSDFPPRVENKLATKFASKDSENDISGIAARVDAAEGDISALETLTTDGRLSQPSLDARYKRVEDIPHAVFIGSSNSTPGTWVEDFAARMGYVAHNYSIGGGSFTGTGAGTFENQIAAAIADTSYSKALVKYFFLCDVGNDIRAVANVQAKAESVFASAQNAYPNARIIVLPAIWGNAAGNNNGNIHNSISLRYQEIVNASLNFDRVEIIDKSWLWLADSGAWMKPGEVHPNVAGYGRIADFMSKYMRGASTQYNQGIRGVTPKAAINAGESYWTAGRNGDFVTIVENFRINAIGQDTELGQLDYGLWPIQSIQVPVISDVSRTVSGAVAIFPVGSGAPGLIRSYGAIAAGSHTLSVTYRAF